MVKKGQRKGKPVQRAQAAANASSKKGGFWKTVGSIAEKALPIALEVAMALPVSGSQMSAVHSHGATNVAVPRAYGTTRGPHLPKTRQVSQDQLILNHREKICTIKGTSDGKFSLPFIQPFNPGNPAVFRWGSNLARQYTYFEFLSARLITEPNVGTETAGRVYAAFEYNPKEEPPGNTVELMSMETSRSSNTWLPIDMPINPARMKAFAGQKFIRASGPADPQFDAGILYVGSEGTTSDEKLADVYLEYTVKLTVPDYSAGGISCVFSPATPIGAGGTINAIGSAFEGTLSLGINASKFLGTLPILPHFSDAEAQASREMNGFTIVGAGNYVMTISLTNGADTPATTAVGDPQTLSIQPGSSGVRIYELNSNWDTDVTAGGSLAAYGNIGSQTYFIEADEVIQSPSQISVDQSWVAFSNPVDLEPTGYPNEMFVEFLIAEIDDETAAKLIEGLDKVYLGQ